MLEKINGAKLQHTFSDWRPGDQRVYVSDVRKAHHELGWSPRISPELGIGSMRDSMAADLETLALVCSD